METFDKSELDDLFNWHHEPSIWEIKNNQLHIFTDAETDFWQKTHYGFQADNGHFLYTELTGDFILETEVECDFKHQYDQAGLMIRVSEECWIKTSVEFELNAPNKLGVVVTNNGFSDWSTQDVEISLTKFKLQIVRVGSDYKVSFFDVKTKNWIQLRMLHLIDKPIVKVGMYACSPKEKLFSAAFNYLKINKT